MGYAVRALKGKLEYTSADKSEFKLQFRRRRVKVDQLKKTALVYKLYDFGKLSAFFPFHATCKCLAVKIESWPHLKMVLLRGVGEEGGDMEGGIVGDSNYTSSSRRIRSIFYVVMIGLFFAMLFIVG